LAAFCVPLSAYLILGLLLALKYHSYVGDAQSRLANAYYVLFSRDPHLAAIGFVWNPLSSLLDLPLLLLHPLIPALTVEGVAANAVSSVAMAGAGYQLFRFSEDMSVGRILRWVLLLLFVGNPMILFFGANGMSEALFIFLLVLAARYLARWFTDDSARSLLITGFALGFAYLARNEAVVPAGIATIVIFVGAFGRAKGRRDERRRRGLVDAVLFVTPSIVAFAGWAIVSWVIVGHPFEQFSSQYGTSSQLKLLGGNFTNYVTTPTRFWFAVQASWWMAPGLVVLVLVAAKRAWHERDPTVVAITSILGGVMVFEIGAFALGKTGYAFRYYIYAVPLAAMVAACLARPRPLGRQRWVLVVGRRLLPVGKSTFAVWAVALSLLGIFANEHAMLYSRYDSLDQLNLSFVLWPGSESARLDPLRGQWASIQVVAHQIDALRVGHGAVMVDNFEPCIPQVIMSSKNAKQFSIPNDQDFVQRLGAPYQQGVRYLLAAQQAGFGLVDALNRQWPTLYADGGGVASLVGTIHFAGCPDMRLYRVIPASS
jgi:hypothetical protein